MKVLTRRKWKLWSTTKSNVCDMPIWVNLVVAEILGDLKKAVIFWPTC